ncbi:hypothetical protein [Limimaricola cinnabarinus]|uniref:hypothetical protein n=1 Tax=Limimaricola cinnabarinus TaxID=1125964 RepID=UPI00249121B0|nr:hypothetical protein [Limimaricola cinnabarinus]
MTIYVPKGIRPPGVFPTAPRVIYKTKRKNLSHAGRIGRIDRFETLSAFRAFSHAFQAHRPRLAPDLAGYLHNAGFLPDKAALYGLPDDRLDSFLSDFQVAILPMANGHTAPALSNRQIFWRLYNGLLPLAPLVGTADRGGVHPVAAGAAEGPILARASTAAVTRTTLHARLPDNAGMSAEQIFLRLPAGQETGARLLRLAIVFDPGEKLPFVAGAVLLEGALDTLDDPGATLVSRGIDPETGEAGQAWRMTRGATTPPEPVPAEQAPRPVGEWWSTLMPLLAGLRRLPVFSVLQLDILETAGGPLVIDATERLDAATQQVHGPLMKSAATVRFIREFGV